MLESVDSFFYHRSKSTSITLSITGIRLIVLPISAGNGCTLSLGNKVLDKLMTNKYNQYKKLYEKNQQTINFLISYTEKLYKIM